MKRIHLYLFSFLLSIPLFLVSCGATSHPNEKVIAGKWVPVKVEKINDSPQPAPDATVRPGERAEQKAGAPNAGAGDGGAAKKREALERLAHTEMHAVMEINPDHTAVKNFPGRPLKASWKMKGRGKRIVARNLENKQKFTIDILEVTKERMVVIEHAPVGDLKITYARQE
ncbi:MAG TPA: hypothetical protein PKG48_04060 [Bacteroidales bacterium]|nr:hypothetical protein [Bacteroidales bacterium]HPS61618.1 hypothetical protein [Bacteroidales bacterium]